MEDPDLVFAASAAPNGRYVEIEIDAGKSTILKLLLTPAEVTDLQEKLALASRKFERGEK